MSPTVCVHGLRAPRCGIAKLLPLAALFFASLTLVLSVASGEQEIPEVDIDIENAVDTPDSVKTSTFFGGYVPYYRWWPVDYCGWDFYTTGIWQVTFVGGLCNNAYGTKLANYARSRMTSRTFGALMMGVSPTISTVLCGKSVQAGQVVYTVQLRVPNTPPGRQMLQGLRSTNRVGVQLARTMYNAGSTRSVGGFPKGKWCNRSASCLDARSPAVTGFKTGLCVLCFVRVLMLTSSCREEAYGRLASSTHDLLICRV
jgi:hypothetical protein